MRASIKTTMLVAGAAAIAMTAAVEAGAQDLANGQRVFRQCQACHKLEEGRHGVGPSLHQVFGGPAGQVEGFRYSPAHLAKAEEGLVWTDEVLMTYLENPRKFIPGNRMAFAGLRREQDRIDVIAYVKENGGVYQGE